MLKILLDLDGVLTNWEKGVCDLFGLDYGQTIDEWPPGEFGIEHAIGISEDEIWEKIHGVGESWWAGLEEYPWARMLYGGCCEIADTYFVTSPSQHPSSLSGKLTWMQKFTGQDKFRNYMVGPKKYLCARPDQVLIDDSDKNINQFRERGGLGILFPRMNNSNWENGLYPAQYAINILDNIKDVMGELTGA